MSQTYIITQSYEHLITGAALLSRILITLIGWRNIYASDSADIWQVIKQDKLPTINSIICVEDAVIMWS